MRTLHELYFFLSQLKGIGPRKTKALTAWFQTADSFFTASQKSEFRKIPQISEMDIENIWYHRKIWDMNLEREKIDKKNIRFIAMSDESYPKSLRHIYAPPVGIYVKGRLPEEVQGSGTQEGNSFSVAVIGARNCSCYGRDMARAFSCKLSEAGIPIISGMAKGIDGYAHEGAMMGRSSSFAVLGNGVDICYPMENIRVYENLIRYGGVISEYPPGTRARPEYFPMRNRIISGMSRGVLVIEAKERSGSLITVESALEQGRDIFAIPGRIHDPLSQGCNNLIKMGANLVNSIEDILEFYQINILKNSKDLKKNNIVLETTEKIVYANLRCEPKHIEEIIRDSGILSNKVLKALISLECKGLCQQVRQNYYIKNVV